MTVTVGIPSMPSIAVSVNRIAVEVTTSGPPGPGGGGTGSTDIIVGTTPPGPEDGSDGQFYLDEDDQILYGPKEPVVFTPTPDPVVVGYTQDSNATLASFTFTAPAGVQDGDLLVAFLNTQAASLSASVIPGWADVWKGTGASMGPTTRWSQIVCRWYSAADPGPWTLPVEASHATYRKIGTLVAVRNATPPTSMPLYDSPTDTSVSVAVAAATTSLLIANWHAVMSATNRGTLLTHSGTLLTSKGYPVSDGSGSADFQHVIAQTITGGTGTLSLTTTGPAYSAEKTTGALFARYPTPNPITPYADVADMLTRTPFYWAHRGGSESTWGEHSQFTYDKAVQWGAPVLEISLNRTSDGVWFALHDSTINRTSPSAPANSDPTAMTWAQVNAYQQTYPGVTVPYLRLDTFLDRYKDSGVLIVVDPKYRNTTPLWAELLDQVLAKFPAGKVIAKGFYNGANWATYARSRGLKTWGYLYSADVPSLGPFVTNWDILGLDQVCTQAEWDTVKAYGKPVVGHIISDLAEANDALTKGAAGLQVANIPAVIPRKPLASEVSEAWPVALAGLPPGGTTGQALAKTSAADYAAGWATPSGGPGGGVTDHGALTGLSDPDHPIAAVQGLQTALDGKALTQHTHQIGDLPTGTSGSTVAIGNHTHAAYEASGAVATHDALTTAHSALRGTLTPASIGTDTTAVGTSTTFARADHKHPALVGNPVALGAAIAGGSSTNLSRADHVHPYPTAAQVGADPAGTAAARTPVIVASTTAPGDTSAIWMDLN